MIMNDNEAILSTGNNQSTGFDYKAYTKHYRQTHPEQALLWRIHSSIKFLEKHGYKVSAVQNTDKE